VAILVDGAADAPVDVESSNAHAAARARRARRRARLARLENAARPDSDACEAWMPDPPVDEGQSRGERLA
jgi:hypothetical protein